jgi:hypothetical protein
MLYQSAGFKDTEELTHELWGSVVTEVRYELELEGINSPSDHRRM